MNTLETQWWLMDIPPEWETEQDDELIVVSDEDGVGEIAITTLVKEDGNVDDQQLRQLAADTEALAGAPKVVECGDFHGYCYSFKEDNEAVREWYLGLDNTVLLVTYCCDLDNAGMDDGAVDDILSTLLLKSAEQSH
jgi:hypothetical protein